MPAHLADSVDRAFARRGDGISACRRALPEALLEGFAWDVEARRYEDLPSLVGYAMRVAGTVGVMMALLMGNTRRRHAVRGLRPRLRDAAHQYRPRLWARMRKAGRLYLPLSWLRAEGIDPAAWLAEPRFTPGIGRVVGEATGGGRTTLCPCGARRRAAAGAVPPRYPGGTAAVWTALATRVAQAGHDSVIGTGRGAAHPQAGAARRLPHWKKRRVAVSIGGRATSW